MTGRCLFFTLLTVGCAAAVPAAHGDFGGGHSALHASWHGAHGEGMPTADAIRAHVDAALDELGLEPPTRAAAKAILEPHLERAIALHEKASSGELEPDAAFAEHEQILAAAKSAGGTRRDGSLPLPSCLASWIVLDIPCCPTRPRC